MKTPFRIFPAALLLTVRAFSAPTGDPIATLPAEAVPLAREAKAKFDAGNFLEAKSLYEKALVAAPDNRHLLSNLGVACYRADLPQLAEEAFRKAIARERADTFSLCALGIVHWSQGRYDDAVNKLTRALSLDPRIATAHYYLGLVAVEKGWLEAAGKENETALKLDSRYGNSALRNGNRLPLLDDFLTSAERDRCKLPERK